MADYFTPTVVQQEIPAELISPFEKLLLAAIFEHEEENGKIYYFASEASSDFLTLDRADLEHALAATTAKSRLKTFVQEQIDATPAVCADIDLDLTVSLYGSDAYLVILQDIVRRSKGALPYLTITESWTCSKIRPDALGGQAIIITPRAIRTWSTYRYLEAFTGRFEQKQCANMPP